jgi:hypothetical protein
MERGRWRWKDGEKAAVSAAHVRRADSEFDFVTGWCNLIYISGGFRAGFHTRAVDGESPDRNLVVWSLRPSVAPLGPAQPDERLPAAS